MQKTALLYNLIFVLIQKPLLFFISLSLKSSFKILLLVLLRIFYYFFNVSSTLSLVLKFAYSNWVGVFFSSFYYSSFISFQNASPVDFYHYYPIIKRTSYNNGQNKQCSNRHIVYFKCVISISLLICLLAMSWTCFGLRLIWYFVLLFIKKTTRI